MPCCQRCNRAVDNTVGLATTNCPMHTKLLRSQRNAVFEVMSAAGLEPRDFVWSEVPSSQEADRPVERLTHVPSGYYFTFDKQFGVAGPHYRPSQKEVVETSTGPLQTWEQVLSHVKVWAEILKREVLEPDLWKIFSEDNRLVGASIDDVENLPFTPQEQERIKLAIVELRAFLHATCAHSEAHLAFIDIRLKHLEEASSRLGRKDWITLAIGALTNIIVGAALAPEAARELVRTAGALLGWIVSGVQLLL